MHALIDYFINILDIERGDWDEDENIKRVSAS